MKKMNGYFPYMICIESSNLIQIFVMFVQIVEMRGIDEVIELVHISIEEDLGEMK